MGEHFADPDGNEKKELIEDSRKLERGDLQPKGYKQTQLKINLHYYEISFQSIKETLHDLKTAVSELNRNISRLSIAQINSTVLNCAWSFFVLVLLIFVTLHGKFISFFLYHFIIHQKT